mgnify:CR=1 FL=1
MTYPALMALDDRMLRERAAHPAGVALVRVDPDTALELAYLAYDALPAARRRPIAAAASISRRRVFQTDCCAAIRRRASALMSPNCSAGLSPSSDTVAFPSRTSSRRRPVSRKCPRSASTTRPK